jgi:hypothetical protein
MLFDALADIETITVIRCPPPLFTAKTASSEQPSTAAS